MRQLIKLAVALAFLSVSHSAAAERAVLSEKEIKEVVNDHAGEIKRCYARHALRQKRATGRVTLSMVVDRDGTVRNDTIDVEAEGVRGKKFRRCVVSRVSSWEFPEAKSPTEIQYPFYFQHTRR